MALVFADQDDLTAWNPDLEPETALPRYLRVASGLVQRAIAAARYDTTSGGLPSDPDLAAVLTDAVCAQVEFWCVNTIDPGTSSVKQSEKTVKSKSLGGRSVTFSDDDPTVTAARATAGAVLCDEARLILLNAGFLSGQPGWA